MLVQPSGEMKTDSLISLNTVSNRMSAPLTGGLASFEYNRRWWRNTMLKHILIRFYMGKQGGDSSGYLRLYFSSHPGPNLYSRLKWVDLCMNAHTPKVILLLIQVALCLLYFSTSGTSHLVRQSILKTILLK